MSFAAPWALVGLALAGIPILLHLLARREPPTVAFPATRYLADAARLHQRRLQLQHLLLLVVRTVLIVALVVAAAGPSWPTAGLGAHAPTALVLVVDNSLSSGIIENGVPALDDMKAAARGVLDRAAPDDRLWMVTADGTILPGGAAELRRRVDSLTSLARRLDLGEAVALANAVLEDADRPGEIVVVSDLQRSALAGDPQRTPMVVLRPTRPPPSNAGLAEVSVGAQPWGPEGGTVRVVVGGRGDDARPVTVTTTDRPPKQLLIRPGGQNSVKLTNLAAGWSAIETVLDPDELRADDRRTIAVRVSPAARMSWPADDRYLATAVEVLAQNGRVTPGTDVTFGALGAGASIVLPPADPARLGALNRSLAARGSRWRFGDLDLTPAAVDSGPWLSRERVVRRHQLVFQGGAPSDVLVTVAGRPWAVRSGRIVLLASRLDPEWTSLPLSAGFLPFVDGLVNRAARGELASLAGAPGDPILVPDRVTAIAAGSERWRVEGGAAFTPPRLGIYYLLVDRDTVGTLAANPDPRESDLARAADAEVLGLWPNARLGEFSRAAEMAFKASARSDLRGPLLWLAAGLALLEVILASVRRRRA